MNINNADLKPMYEHYLTLFSKGVERTPVSPELLITLIERIEALEADSSNLNSYLHYECQTKIKKEIEKAKTEKERADSLLKEVLDLQQRTI